MFFFFYDMNLTRGEMTPQKLKRFFLKHFLSFPKEKNIQEIIKNYEDICTRDLLKVFA